MCMCVYITCTYACNNYIRFLKQASSTNTSFTLKRILAFHFSDIV